MFPTISQKSLVKGSQSWQMKIQQAQGNLNFRSATNNCIGMTHALRGTCLHYYITCSLIFMFKWMPFILCHSCNLLINVLFSFPYFPTILSWIHFPMKRSVLTFWLLLENSNLQHRLSATESRVVRVSPANTLCHLSEQELHASPKWVFTQHIISTKVASLLFSGKGGKETHVSLMGRTWDRENGVIHQAPSRLLVPRRLTFQGIIHSTGGDTEG